MKYDIDWVKGLSDSDLILCNLLSFMCIYHYNMRFDNIKQSVLLERAEAQGITKITVRLRTRSNKTYTPPPYYIPDEEAELFLEKLINYYEARSG